MIRHTIFFKTKTNATQQEVNEAISAIISLQHQLPGIVSIIGGPCLDHEGKFDDLFSHAISIDFKDQRAKDEFLTNPVTHPAKGAIINVVKGGYDGVVGFDLVY